VRNKALAAVALAALLAPACRRAQEEPSQSGPSSASGLAAPSAAPVTNPLTKGATAYTNEQQATYLQDQAEQMGIARLTNITPLGTDSDAPLPTITEEEGLERTRALEKALAAQRHAIDRNKPEAVALPGATPHLLQTTNNEPTSLGGPTVPVTPPATP
jgi:hypothetical protein